MFRFLTITVAVCFLFIQDAQAAVASNLREIQLEEELLRALETEREVPVTGSIYAEVTLHSDGRAFFAVDDETNRVFKETIPGYDVSSAHKSGAFVLCNKGKNYQVTVDTITRGKDDINMQVNKFCLVECP